MMKQVLICIVIFFSTGACAGQYYSDSSGKLLAQYNCVLSTLHPDTLQRKIVVLYSKGYEIRAVTLDRLLENCIAFYNKEFTNVIFSPQVCILDSSGWAAVVLAIANSIGVYGMPDAEPAVNKIFIAAEKKSVAKLVGMEDNLPDSILSFFDYIALHELGHIFLQRYQHTNTNMKWSNEFLASYFAICYLKQVSDSLGLPQVDDMGWQPKYKSLQTFENLYEDVGPANYAWYQGRFQKLATSLYPKFKVSLLRLFIANFSDSGKKTDARLLLQHLAPEIMNPWLAVMKNP